MPDLPLFWIRRHGYNSRTHLVFPRHSDTDCQVHAKSVTVDLITANRHIDNFCLLLQSFGNFSSVAHFKTPPAPGSETTVYVLDTADMGHAEPDGSNEWEDDLNARLYNAPVSSMHSSVSSPKTKTAGDR